MRQPAHAAPRRTSNAGARALAFVVFGGAVVAAAGCAAVAGLSDYSLEPDEAGAGGAGTGGTGGGASGTGGSAGAVTDGSLDAPPDVPVVPDGAVDAGTPCTTAAQCASGETCCTGNACGRRRNFCVASCKTSGTCPSDFHCCVSPPDGMDCSGQCVPRCSTTSDCLTGQVCDSLVTFTCLGDCRQSAPCPTGRTCDQQNGLCR